MGLPGYLSSEALTLIISQRLLRRLHECYQVRDISNHEIAFYKSIGIEPPETVGTPIGCSGCNNTGYRGRVAAVEVLAPTTELRDLLSKNATQDKLLEHARKEGFLTIVDDGARHVREYRTTPDELTRVLATEEKD
jgi:type IV pilus assembly protein PilB